MDLEAARKTTKPHKIDLYDVFCAALYIIKGGIQWRMLPNEFPKWTTVYFYFQIWSKLQETGFSILEDVLKQQISVHPLDARKRRGLCPLP